MKRSSVSLFLALFFLVSLLPAGALGAEAVLHCRPGDRFYAVFALPEEGDQPQGVLGRLVYDEDVLNVLSSDDLIGKDGVSILLGNPAVIAFKVSRYAPAGEYEINVQVLEAQDEDGTVYQNVQVVPVKLTVESGTEQEEAQAEKAAMEQRLAEIESALTKAEAARSELQNQLETLTVEKNDSEYRLAEMLYEAGDYEGAKALYQKMNDYRDAVKKAEACEEAIVTRKAIQPGEYVTFGHYSQTWSGIDQTPIEWLVLARDGNKALLLSRYG